MLLIQNLCTFMQLYLFSYHLLFQGRVHDLTKGMCGGMRPNPETACEFTVGMDWYLVERFIIYLLP